MAAQAREAVVDIEKYRLQLEANVDKLRKALRHWQTWEAEYESLKEELNALPESAPSDELAATALDLRGSLVNEKEIKDILGFDKAVPRKVPQVISLLDRRIDYVHRNVTTIQKQYDEAELKLYDVEAIKQETLTEGGLPLTEINEELDDDGNVISSEVSHPGASSDKVLEVLKKVGIDEKELKNDEDESDEEEAQNVTNAAKEGSSQKVMTRSFPSVHGPEPPPPKKRKSVSFAPEVEIAPEPVTAAVAPAVQPAGSMATKPTVPGITNLAEGSFPKNARVIELDENDMPIAVNAPTDPVRNPIIPPNESEEDARLRREMLQYSMSEVGAVVAQLDLEERGSDESEFSDENYDIDEEDAQDYDYGGTSASDGEDDEDEHGLTRRSQITDSYRKEMEELERKLHGQVFANLGPSPAPEVLNGSMDVSDECEAATKIAADAKILRVQREAEDPQSAVDGNQTASEAISNSKKGVRFAEKLDVAPARTSDKPSLETTDVDTKSSKASAPFGDVVQERPSTGITQAGNTTPARKQSRFKAARSSVAAAQAPPVNNQPLADTVFERSPGTTRAKPPSKNDPDILQKQLGMEYVRQRNNMIYRQGGFTKEGTHEDDAEIDADDDATGTPVKKMSRFMAARVRDT